MLCYVCYVIIRLLVPRPQEIRISFTHARGIPVTIVPVPAITAGFTYFSTLFSRETRGYLRVSPHTHARAKLEFQCYLYLFSKGVVWFAQFGFILTFLLIILILTNPCVAL